jgi:hypothetical protein
MRETVRPQEEQKPAAEPAAETPAAPKRKSYPLAATLIGCLLLLASMFSGSDSSGRAADVSNPIAYLMGAMIGGVVLVWGIAWLVTIRHASRGWKWGSLAAIAFVSLLVGATRL